MFKKCLILAITCIIPMKNCLMMALVCFYKLLVYITFILNGYFSNEFLISDMSKDFKITGFYLSKQFYP